MKRWKLGFIGRAVKMRIVGEILGLLFIIVLCWFLKSNPNNSLLDITKILLCVYIPQRIALNLEVRYLLNTKLKKIEDGKEVER